MRYGEHQARSVEALALLLTISDPIPPDELSAVLSCRMALLAAHRERCEVAVRGADVRRAVFQDRHAGRDFGALARSGAAALVQLLDEHPTFADHADRFTDVLQRRDLSAQGATWVEAAKHALLATEAVVTAPNWLRQPGQAWLVAADVSDSAQAIARLDRRVVEAAGESLSRWRSGLRVPSAELALAARHVAYIAQSGDLDGRVDDVWRRETGRVVVPVRTAADLIPAATATVRLLDRCDLSISGLRRFAIMQAEITQLCAGMLDAPEVATMRARFEQRDSSFRALAGATARVANIGPSRDRPLLGQTQEVGKFLLDATRSKVPGPRDLLGDFDVEQQRVSAALAKNVGRALLGGRYLVVDDDSVVLKWRRVAPGEEPPVLQAAHWTDRAAHGDGFPRDLDFAARHVAAMDGQATVISHEADAAPSRTRLRELLASQPYPRRPLAPGHVVSMRL